LEGRTGAIFGALPDWLEGGMGVFPRFTPLIPPGFVAGAVFGGAVGFVSAGGGAEAAPGIFNCPPSDCRGRAAGAGPAGLGGTDGFGFDPGAEDGDPGPLGGLAIKL